MPKQVALMMGKNSVKAEPYAAALLAVSLEPLLNPESIEAVEGLVLGGGTDVNPAHYQEARAPETDEPDDDRDARELSLLAQAMKAGIPVLAICRGMQLLNVFHGGTLSQHIGDSHRKRGMDDAHDILIESGSRLAGIVCESRYKVNSRHHQAIARTGAGLLVTARCPSDDIIEAVEGAARNFVVGVQWHPEDRVSTHTGDRRLFEAFATAIAENRK